MPQFVRIIGCEAPDEAQPRLRELRITEGEDTHTVETLDAALAVATNIHSVKRIRVLYREPYEWLRYGV
jgi:hypothetical protein